MIYRISRKFDSYSKVYELQDMVQVDTDFFQVDQTLFVFTLRDEKPCSMKIKFDRANNITVHPIAKTSHCRFGGTKTKYKDEAIFATGGVVRGWFSKSVEVYLISQDKWIPLGDFKKNHDSHSGCSIEDRVYIYSNSFIEWLDAGS